MQKAPYIDENGCFVRRATLNFKSAKDYAIPISIFKFLRRFESSCTLGCCGFSALRFELPSADDARWTIEFRLENELARERENLAAVSVENLLLFDGHIRKDDLMFLFEWLENGLREIRAQKEAKWSEKSTKKRD